MKLAILLAVLRVLGPKHAEQATKVANAIIEESLSSVPPVDPLLITAIAKAESSFNVKAENFDHQCIGLMQPRRGTSTQKTRKELKDPHVNIREGIRILDEKIVQCGTLPKALRAYNQGSCSPSGKAGKVARHFSNTVILIYERLREEAQKIEVPAPYQFDTQGSET